MTRKMITEKRLRAKVRHIMREEFGTYRTIPRDEALSIDVDPRETKFARQQAEELGCPSSMLGNLFVLDDGRIVVTAYHPTGTPGTVRSEYIEVDDVDEAVEALEAYKDETDQAYGLKRLPDEHFGI